MVVCFFVDHLLRFSYFLFLHPFLFFFFSFFLNMETGFVAVHLCRSAASTVEEKRRQANSRDFSHTDTHTHTHTHTQSFTSPAKMLDSACGKTACPATQARLRSPVHSLFRCCLQTSLPSTLCTLAVPSHRQDHGMQTDICGQDHQTCCKARQCSVHSNVYHQESKMVCCRCE